MRSYASIAGWRQPVAAVTVTRRSQPSLVALLVVIGSLLSLPATADDPRPPLLGPAAAAPGAAGGDALPAADGATEGLPAGESSAADSPGGLTPTEPPTPGAPPRIGSITLNGLQRVDEATVREAIGLRVGEAFSVGDLQRALRSLQELGWFNINLGGPAQGSSVRHSTNPQGQVDVVFDLEENPGVREVRLVGIDQQPTAEALDEALRWIEPGRPMNTNPQRLRQDLDRLERLYRDAFGLAVRAQLPPNTEEAFPPVDAAGDQVDVVIRITRLGPADQRVVDEPPVGPVPGPGAPVAPADETPLIEDQPLRVTQIRVVPEGFRDLVMDIIETREGANYDDDMLRRDMRAIVDTGLFYSPEQRDALSAQGYPLPSDPTLGSRVRAIRDGEGGVVVTFDLVPNPLIRNVVIHGNTLFTDEELIAEMAWLRPDRVLNTREDSQGRDLDRLEAYYRERGYFAIARPGENPEDPDAAPFLTPEPDGESVTVHLRMDEFRVGSIEFVWNGRPSVKDAVFRHYMSTEPGDFFNFEQIRRDLNEIMALDIIDDIQLQPELVPAEDDPTALKLVFEVTGKRTGNLAGGGGLSSRYGLVGFVDVSENNLWGLAHRAAARVEFGGRFNFVTSYFWPLLDNAGTEVQLRLYNTEDRTSASGLGAFTDRRSSFDQLRRGGSLLVSRPISRDIRGSITYTLENVSTERRGAFLPNLPPFPFQDIASETTSSVTLGVNRDTRDFPLDATSGGYQSLSAEYAGLGGDSNYGKYTLELRHYIPIGGQTLELRQRERSAWVFAGRLRFGTSHGDLPFGQSFFIGGADTLRGYDEDRFFGDTALLLNLELRRAINETFQAVAFFDAGRAWREGESVDLLSELATAVGLGTRVNTPVGPIRLDIGWGGDGMQTHFSFGQMF